jgi:hypothetical protein
MLTPVNDVPSGSKRYSAKNARRIQQLKIAFASFLANDSSGPNNESGQSPIMIGGQP